MVMASLRLSRNLFSRRTFSVVSLARVDKASGGFGEEARQAAGQESVKDTAPYQNEYTKSGTNSEVAHNDESYSSNTNPEESNRQQGDSLDGSPANEEYSADATPNKSNKTHRDPSNASGTHNAGGMKKGNASSGTNRASGADVSKDKFDKLSKSHDDVQQVGGRSVTN